METNAAVDWVARGGFFLGCVLSGLGAHYLQKFNDKQEQPSKNENLMAAIAPLTTQVAGIAKAFQELQDRTKSEEIDARFRAIETKQKIYDEDLEHLFRIAGTRRRFGRR